MNLAQPSPAASAGSAPPDGAAIRIEGVTKRYGSRGVLAGLGLSIEEGAAVALIGANGAGKSTLLKTLIRLVEPDSGRIAMLGTEVTALDRAALKTFRTQVGMVFQRHNLVGRLSVLTNVVHGVQARAAGRAPGCRRWPRARRARRRWPASTPSASPTGRASAPIRSPAASPSAWRSRGC